MKELLELLPEKYKNEDFYENLFNYYKEKESASYIFEYIPDEYKTKRMAIEALNENKFIWWYIPKKLIDIELVCEFQKKHGGANLIEREVPSGIINSYDDYLKLVQANGAILRYVPDNMKSLEICNLALKNTGNAISYIPQNILTYDMCLDAVKKSGLAISDIPEKFKTEEICLEAVKNVPYYYLRGSIPENLLTLEICLEASKSDSNILFYKEIPQKFKTYDFYFNSIKYGKNIYVLEEMPKEMFNPEICNEAVSIDGDALKYIPEDLITEEMCRIALKAKTTQSSSLYTLAYVPKKFKTDELCIAGYKQYAKQFDYIPKEKLTLEMWNKLIKVNGHAISKMPTELITPEISILALNNGAFVSEVPEKFRIPEMANIELNYILTKKNYTGGVSNLHNALMDFLKDTPTEMITLEMAKLIIKECPNCHILSLIPKELITSEMYDEIRWINKEFVKSIPRDLLTQDRAVSFLIKGNHKEIFEALPQRFKNNSLAVDFFEKINVIKKEPKIVNDTVTNKEMSEYEKLLYKTIALYTQGILSQYGLDDNLSLEIISNTTGINPTKLQNLKSKHDSQMAIDKLDQQREGMFDNEKIMTTPTPKR